MVAVGIDALGIRADDQSAVTEFAEQATIEFQTEVSILNGEDVASRLRTPQVSLIASEIAQNPGVRSALVEKQRLIAHGMNIVCEGRDQGTVVFPDAEFKFFLTAVEEVRAQRRLEELLSQGREATFQQVLNEQRERDERDATRDVAPLAPAKDAIRIDTTGLRIEEVIEELMGTIQGKTQAEND